MATNLKDIFTKMRPKGLTKWLLLACLVVIASHSGEAAETRVVCYYTNWSVYRPGTAKFNPQNINPYLCTHLIYAFGGFTKENTLKPFDKYQDIEKGGYAKFTGLKTYNPNLKTMIAIGGWNEGSSRFSSLVSSAERRRELVKNSIKFLRLNKFDGLDLDWEYPAFRDGGKPKDRANYAKLVQELRQEFDKEAEATGRPRLLLTMAVPAGIQYIDKGYDVPKLNRYLDWFNLLSYDYHSALEPAVDHHSPLYPLEAASEYNFEADLNIDYSIKYYIEKGADRDKLVLGIPTYGRSYTLFNPESHALGAPADGPGEQGDGTREKGYLAYYEICESLLPKTRSKRQADEDEDEEEYEDEEEEPWTVVQPNPRAMGPYAFKGNQWVGYDDIDIVTKKAQYVAENGLGGIMFWSIDNDDFRGKCHGKPYPLIEAAKVALYKSLGVTEKIPEKKPLTTRKRTRPSKPSKTSDDDKDLSKNTIRNNKKKNKDEPEEEATTKSTRIRQNLIKRGSSTAAPQAASTPDWGLNTPEPPTTPDPGTDFKCEEEGFFPHPRDCKKYFWCLDSGPSNLGIVAHQFTCPSGLYFNKAADSCDFTRNVLCNNKKTAVTSAPPAPRTSTTSTTEAPSTSSPTTSTSRPPSNLAALFTTRRPLPRITAATSSTTLLARSTTAASPVSEEEYEDEEDVAVDIPEIDSEEDPKVIKELVDLIKKLGGIEQLEKHLANTANNNQGTKTTTPATISRLLYERVLSQARPNSERVPPQLNSRGPQSAGLVGTGDEKDSGSRRERPQYTTINRRRPVTTTEEAEDESIEASDEEEDDDRQDFRRPSFTTSKSALPQYVNIRRARPSTSTEPEPTIRNALFERDSSESTSDNNDVKNGVQGFDAAAIRKFRPESQEVTTSKYKSIQRVRSSTVSTVKEEKEETERSTVSSHEISTEVPVTFSPSTESSVMTSPKYATVSRFPNTSPPAIETTTTYNPNDVTEVNDINVDIASPSFASENGIIKNIDSSSVLNSQITTLSNIPKSKDDSLNSVRPTPVTYSTEVTISEEQSSSTQKVPLFAKRSRPTTTTTTANLPDITETTTSSNKMATTIQSVTEVPSSDNTIASGADLKTESSVTARPNFFSRRPSNRINFKVDQSRRSTSTTVPSNVSTTDPTTTPGNRFSSLRKRPTFERRRTTPSSLTGDASATEAEATTKAARPTRLFVRKFQRSGASSNSTTTQRPTVTASPETTSRKNFRVGVRRRPATFTTTTKAIPSSSDVNFSDAVVPTTQSALSTDSKDQESHSTIQQVQEKGSSGEISPKKRIIKIQKRPLNALKNKELRDSKEDESPRNVSRKYSSVIKSDNTLVQIEKGSNENIGAELSIEDIGGDVTAAVAVAAHHLSVAPLPTIPPYAQDDQDDNLYTEEVPLTRAYLLASPSAPFISPNDYIATTQRYQSRSKFTIPQKSRRISTTVSPQIYYSPSVTPPVVRRRKPSSPPAAFEKINPVKKIYRTVVDYEYYDDDDVRIVEKAPLQGKVLVLNSGGIRCLDQGNFPHPESCKKFISCAKMENGDVYGWAYTCPKGLSFDPVGGICNWSAGLGCQD